MYDDLLLPTDGGDGTRTAVAHAVAVAEAFDATVHVLSVADTRNRFESPTSGLAGDAWIAAERDRAQEAADAVVAELPGTLDTETAVREGVPASEIVAYVEEAGIDVVTMATHGRTGLSRYLIGSVTEKVVRTSPVPVLTVDSSGDG
jgi:nucleotide-binding universal stress UspA family protein